MLNNKAETQPKKRVRSPYLFPAYGLGHAIQVAQRVETDGGGTLSEETLAIALGGSSTKSSTFRLQTLTPRQFGLLDKNGPNLSTTSLAKAIFKPTSDQEKANALWNAFLSIPLFRAVAERFEGHPVPQREAIRNILEREFGLQHNRVADAERVLMGSAREAGAMQTSGGNVYLALAGIAATTTAPAQPAQEPVQPSAGGQFAVTEQDLALLDDDEFESLWTGLGKIARRRGRRQLDAENRDDETKVDSG